MAEGKQEGKRKRKPAGKRARWRKRKRRKGRNRSRRGKKLIKIALKTLRAKDMRKKSIQRRT